MRLPLLFSEGVDKGRISLEQFVAITATNPDKIYGLYPRKGTIAVGSDADIAIWDPDLEVTISHEMMHDAMDYTPYEGRRLKGYPVTTLSRGIVVWDGKECKGVPGYGQFLRCDLPGPAVPRGEFVAGFDPETGTFVD